MLNDSDFTTITEQKIPPHVSTLMSPYLMPAVEHSNNCPPDSNVTLEEFTAWKNNSILLVLAMIYQCLVIGFPPLEQILVKIICEKIFVI